MSDLGFWLAVLSTTAFLVGLAITYGLHSQHQLDVIASPESQPGDSPSVLPWITVIIPARNEKRNIRRCLQAILDQTYPNLEVIVVDDRSSDGTAAILEEIVTARKNQPEAPVLRVVQGKDLPPGWAGKPHALAQGEAQARGDWLCFLDADTFAMPELIAATYAVAVEHRADLFTIFTRQELGSFWEKVIQPLVFTALVVGFSPQQVNDPHRPEAVANGQFILIRREVYDAVGGHAAIREQIVEDKALAERVKRGGYRLFVGDGRPVARTRMYTRLSEIWEGWTKNIYLGLRDRLGLLFLGAMVGLLAALVLPLWLLAGLAWYFLSLSPWAGLVALQALILWAVLIFARMQVSKSFGISRFYAFTLPLGAMVFTAMMFISTLKVLSGRGVTWKGRRYTA
jgi:chlorobactene glucosyltransferase